MYSECCPLGYVQIRTSYDCERAFDFLYFHGVFWGGIAQHHTGTTGCAINVLHQAMYFFPPDGNEYILGDDEIICKLETYAQGELLLLETNHQLKQIEHLYF